MKFEIFRIRKFEKTNVVGDLIFQEVSIKTADRSVCCIWSHSFDLSGSSWNSAHEEQQLQEGNIDGAAAAALVDPKSSKFAEFSPNFEPGVSTVDTSGSP
jgi:hypothetical protein